MGIDLDGVFLGDASHKQLCWNCATKEAIELLGCIFGA